MDLVFFGSGSFGLPTLERLARTHTLRAIVTQPDRPAGRGSALTPTPIAAWARTNLPGTPILKPEKVNDAPSVRQIRAAGAGAWVVIAFGHKLGTALLDGVFAINLHASLLPRWRGAAPINAAILAGDPVTGNSVITLAERMDAGLVLAQSTLAIDPLETAGELHDRLAAAGPALVEDVLARHASRSLEPIAQDESAVTIAPKLSRSDSWLDWSAPAEHCRRRVHGLNPWPGVSVTLRAEALKLLRVQPAPGPTESNPGTITDADAGLVACGGGTMLKLLVVQPPGKHPMPWPDFARGRRVTAGEALQGGRPGC